MAPRPDDVRPVFYQNVTRGATSARAPARGGEQYHRFGGILDDKCAVSRPDREADPEFLRARSRVPIYWGNRNGNHCCRAVQQMRDERDPSRPASSRRSIASYSSCRQYLDDIARARDAVGDGDPEVQRLRHYFDHPGFVNHCRATWPRPSPPHRDGDSKHGDGGEPALLYSAHSIPTAMAQASVLRGATCEVSPSGTEKCAPGHPWSLVAEPPAVPHGAVARADVGDALTALAAGGTRSVVVRRSGFISDHMEVVYDLDVLAAERAAAMGLRFTRAATVGAAPEFVAMIRQLVEERLDRSAPRPTPRSKGRSGPALGRLGVRPDCVAGCCPPG